MTVKHKNSKHKTILGQQSSGGLAGLDGSLCVAPSQRHLKSGLSGTLKQLNLLIFLSHYPSSINYSPSPLSFSTVSGPLISHRVSPCGLSSGIAKLLTWWLRSSKSTKVEAARLLTT